LRVPASAVEDKKPGAGAAILPPRRETFLAHYPRKLKIGVTLGVLFILTLPAYLDEAKSVHRAMSGKSALHIPLIGSDSTKPTDTNPEVSATPAAPTAADIAAAAENDALSENARMVAAPEADITEDTSAGSLPRISEDGRQPWQVYARPFNTNDKRPRIALVITDIGLTRIASDAAIDQLPPNVTLLFDAQSPVVGAWCSRARQVGHETILDVPMEPFDYPRSDPGPNTLLTNLPNGDNKQRLLTALRQASGYVGVTTLSGSRFTTDPDRFLPILEELHKRGLLMFDAKTAPHGAVVDLAKEAHVPVATMTQRLDANLAPEAIDAALNQLEQTARLTGHAVGISASVPVMIDKLKPWIAKLRSDGIVLAPLSSVVQ
jgi:polysaccharide deacetylase 2 family uncharacterized protein YibQ